MMDLEPHLLIVDDDERIRGLLQKFLMRNGFLVSAARDAAHARRILSGLEFDMIILDVMMPGEDGVSLTSAKSGRWMCRSPGCGARSKPTPNSRAICKLCAARAICWHLIKHAAQAAWPSARVFWAR